MTHCMTVYFNTTQSGMPQIWDARTLTCVTVWAVKAVQAERGDQTRLRLRRTFKMSQRIWLSLATVIIWSLIVSTVFSTTLCESAAGYVNSVFNHWFIPTLPPGDTNSGYIHPSSLVCSWLQGQSVLNVKRHHHKSNTSKVPTLPHRYNQL